MAVAPGLLFWLLLLSQPRQVPGQPVSDMNRRFLKHKLCGNEECNMLMYRGEASENFTGPDCRFLNFKKGDPLFVYYKLAGGSHEVWAGTTGHTFGYFPKDLMQVVHEHAEEELQVPADERDFVCFEGGEDNLDTYNIDKLLGFLELRSFATGDSEKGIITTKSTPFNDVGEKKQLETNAEDPENPTPLEKDAFGLVYSFMFHLTKMVFTILPDDVQPHLHHYQQPRKPILIISFLGIVSLAIFLWRNVLVVKERMYQVTEEQLAEKVKMMRNENAELVQKISDYEQKIARCLSIKRKQQENMGEHHHSPSGSPLNVGSD